MHSKIILNMTMHKFIHRSGGRERFDKNTSHILFCLEDLKLTLFLYILMAYTAYTKSKGLMLTLHMIYLCGLHGGKRYKHLMI